MIDKRLLQLISIYVIGTDVSTRGSLMWEETGVYPFTYNHCQLQGSKLGSQR